MYDAHCQSKYSVDLFAREKAIRFFPFLRELNEAMEYSIDLTTSPWEFALQFCNARELEVNQNDLRWMVFKGWIKHQSKNAEFLEQNSRPDVQQGSRFIISNEGVAVFNSLIACEPENLISKNAVHSKSRGNSGNRSKPDWNAERKELSFYGKVVKRFRWPAPNQETVLSVFSEEDWPARIEDPLPQGNGLDPKRRLGDTIKCLNRNQFESLIRFRGDGTGEGVLWDIATSEPQNLRATEVFAKHEYMQVNKMCQERMALPFDI